VRVPAAHAHAVAGTHAPMYFPNINFLRAVAALLVLVYHVVELAPWPSFPTEGVLLLFRVGWVGVDLFFVISGFVIGLSAIRLHREHAPDYRWTFMRRRLARIVPLYVVTGAAFLLFVQPSPLLVSWKALAVGIASHLAFLHNLHPGLHGSINGPNWSVAAEMQFYVLAILAVPLLSRIDLRWLFAGGVLVAWASRAIAFWSTQGLGPAVTFVYATQVPAMLDAFAIGLCIARLHLDGTLARWMARSRFVPALATALAFAVALYFTWDAYWAHIDYWTNAGMVVFWRTALALTFGALVLFASEIPDLTRVALLRPLDYLGEVSYGIYLWHLPVILTLRSHWPELPPATLLALTIAIVIALSAATWHLLERPIIRRLR
jgi:peptidoglycan/LPS O-acetylase OafA/YrhL